MQPPLFKPLEPAFKRLRINSIRTSESEPPFGKTRKSIALLGCFDPVTVRYVGGDTPYELCDGADRIQNLKALGVEEVDAVVLPEGTTEAEGALVGFLANTARRDNPIDEALKLKKVLATGVDIGTLATLTGVPKATLEQRTRLLELPPQLVEAAKAGTISAGVALALTKLPKAEQRELETRLTQQGKLTANDVKAARRSRKEADLADLEEALFNERETASPLETFREAVFNALSNGLEPRALIAVIEEVSHVRS
jgi:ParB-like chromosome segregation protein Spo0J